MIKDGVGTEIGRFLLGYQKLNKCEMGSYMFISIIKQTIKEKKSENVVKKVKHKFKIII